MTAVASNAVLQRAAARGCVLLGGAVLAGWWLDIDSLKHVLPGLVSMKFNTALAFVLAGGGLWAVDPRSALGRASRAAAWALLALGAASAFESISGLDLGIDQFFVADPDAPTQPGRMALATATGFVLLAIGLLALPAARTRPEGTAERAASRLAVARVAALAVGGIGALALVGYGTDVDIFYSLPGFGSVAAHTAAGFVVAALGLSAALPRAAVPATPASEGARLIRLGSSAIALTALITGVVAFGLLAHNVRQTLAQGLTLAFESRAERIVSNLENRSERAAIVATRTALLGELRRLAEAPGDASAIQTVRGVLASFDVHGFARIEVRDAAGRVVAHTGAPEPAGVELAVRLAGARERQLVWHDQAFYLRMREPLADAQGPLGTVESEQFLPGLTWLMRHTPPPWASTDFRLCAVAASELRCFPSLRHAHPTRERRGGVEPDPLPTQPEGFHTLTHAGLRTLGVSGSVGNTGLVAAIEVNAAELYAPLTRNFLWTLLLIAALASASTWLLRRRMQPLVMRLVDAEAQAREHLAALEANAALLRSVFDDSPDAILVVDADGQILEASPRVKTLFGYARVQMLGQPVEMLLPERHRAAHPGHRADFARHPHARPMGSGLALAGRRADGSEFPLDVVLSPISGSDPPRSIAIVRDISERRAAEKRIADALAEKTVLLQEVHHRVKNNLQVISSLLNLQAGNSEDAAVRAALADSQGRVKSMALLHQQLYESSDFARIDLGAYLTQLVRLALSSASAANIRLEFDLAVMQLDLQRAVPCGLLVNELVSNVFKHAFPDRRAGTLFIELHAPGDDGRALLAVADDGVGLPAEVQPGNTRSLGLQLVPLLVSQLGAELTLIREHGTRYEIRFKP